MSRYAIPRARFHEIIGRIAERQVLIVGDVGVDRYTAGSASRLSPEAPVPIVTVDSVTDKLGLASNVADNIKTFGAEPFLAALIGADRNGEELLALFRERGISTAYLFQHMTRRTILKERVIAQNQQVVRIDHEVSEPLTAAAEEFFCEKLRTLVGKYDGIILEDYGKGLMTDKVLRFIIESAKSEKKFIAVDPPSTGTRSPQSYRGVSIITPNTSEAEKLAGVDIRDEKSLYIAGEKLLKELDIPIVVITRGRAGMTLFTRDAKPVTIPTFARAVFDVSGAGDTVVSMLTLALTSGATLEESALLANFAAGVEVGKPGTATVTIEELEEYMVKLGGII